jgi:hypothetical protein
MSSSGLWGFFQKELSSPENFGQAVIWRFGASFTGHDEIAALPHPVCRVETKPLGAPGGVGWILTVCFLGSKAYSKDRKKLEDHGPAKRLAPRKLQA